MEQTINYANLSMLISIIAAAALTLFVFAKPIIKISKFILRAAFYSFLVFLSNIVTISFGFTIGLNLISTLIFGFLGIYGVLLFLLTRLIY